MCIAYLEYANLMKELNIPFYWGFKIQTYYQLQSLKNLGVCYVKLDAPLFFDLPTVKRMGIPVRAIPNVAYDDGLPRENGVLGTWIRPEDIDAYDKYVDVIEFNLVEPKQEQALYRIYMEDKSWPTELGLLIKDLNHIGLNRLIRSDISQRRISCGQRCQSGTSCRICYRMLDIANPAVLKDYADRIAKASLEEAEN